MNAQDTLLARAQVGLAFFYGSIFVAMFVLMAIFWDRLTKFDVGLMTMFATGAMNQSKDASAYFFARHRPPNANDPQPGETTREATTPADPAPGPAAP